MEVFPHLGSQKRWWRNYLSSKDQVQSCKSEMRNFKELLIWQKGMQIWEESYDLSRLLPSEERFGLVSQINRASSSIPANIAEGGSRKGVKDQARFIQIALGSAFELETFYLGIQRLKLLEESMVKRVLDLIIEEQKMLSGYLSKLEA